jgi:protein TonB
MSRPAYIDPLSRPARLGVLAAVVFFHVGVGWALSTVHPAKLTVGEMTSMEVRMVAAEAPPEPPVQLDQPVPEDTPPPEVPQLESMIQPPLPDLPPPAFPVQAPPPPPPKPQPPKPPPPKPAPPKPAPAAPPAPAGPRTVSMSQVAYVNPPNAIYPTRSRRSGEQGRVMLRVLVDASGRPAQVALAQSSGHPALDESALSAVRAASFRPFSEGGVPQPVWVNVPIDFVLR